MSKTRNILFLGGSITCGASASKYENSWAPLVFERLSERLGGENRMINASISGTGSFLGAMRLSEHVLPYAPDITFVEFAVNDSGFAKESQDANVCALESIVRRLMAANSEARIIFVYTTVRGQNAMATHHIVAEHYGIPEIDLQTPMLDEINSGRHVWDDFFCDAAHPNDAGHRFYADRITEAIFADLDRFMAPIRPAEPISAIPMRDPHIVPATPDAVFDCEGFTYGLVSDDTHIKHIPELTVTHGLCAKKPGAHLSFRFTGSYFGLYHRLSYNCGSCAVSIDGGPAKKYSFYHPYADSYTGPGEFLCFCRICGLAPGEHTATVTVLDEKDERSTGNNVIIAGFLVG